MRQHFRREKGDGGLFGKIVKVLFPDKCPICGQILSGDRKICNDCEKEVKIIEEPKCVKCGKPLWEDEKLFCEDCKGRQRQFDKCIAVFEYSGNIRKSIHQFKYENARVYADYYGDVAIKLYGDLLKQWKIDVIVPVPIYKKKQIRRGYNQAHVFGEVVSKYSGIPQDEKLLIRIKETVPQKELANTMRYLNLKDAFAIDRDRLKGIKNVLLIDDIFTTGSTLDACSYILKKAGVERVYGLCIGSGRDAAR